MGYYDKIQPQEISELVKKQYALRDLINHCKNYPGSYLNTCAKTATETQMAKLLMANGGRLYDFLAHMDSDLTHLTLNDITELNKKYTIEGYEIPQTPLGY